MTSVPDSGKTDAKRPIGGRASEDEIRIIDLAATYLNQDRGVFLVRAAYSEAVRVIERESRKLTEHLKTA